MQEMSKRLCDYCGEAKAVLYCRADTAKLCFACDRQVHSTNQLFSKHTRSLLCDACDSSPASIFCETEHSVFCQNCDWLKHNNNNNNSKISSYLHNRRPFEGFCGCPSVGEFLSIVGFDDDGAVDGNKAVFLDANNGSFGESDFGNDFLFWDSPGVVSLDDLIASSAGPQHNFNASIVPSMPKDRNATCGQHKQEILNQLRELEKLELNSNNEYIDMESFIGFQSLLPEEASQPENMCAIGENNTINDACKADSTQMCTDGGPTSKQLPDLSTISRSHLQEGCMVPEGLINARMLHDIDHHNQQPGQSVKTESPSVLNSQERGCALSRYKEKRKTRRYEKVVRYESRKFRAQSRTRVKGRFAKINK